MATPGLQWVLQSHYAELFPSSQLIEETKTERKKSIKASLPRLFVYTTVIKIT